MRSDFPSLKGWAKREIGRLMQRLGSPVPKGAARFLVYHSIVPEDRRDPGQMTTPVDLFEAQMTYLAQNGYRVAQATDVVRTLSRGEPAAEKTVALTFDDGFADLESIALPILRRHRFPATIFLIASTQTGDNGRLHNVWGEGIPFSKLRDLQETGLIQFGCHSATHRNLRRLTPKDLQVETRGAKQWLEESLRSPISLFAYPFGSYGTWDDRVRQAVIQAGFEGAFTSLFGVNTASSDRFLLRRSRVSWQDEIPGFERLLQGAYDWYTFIQWVQTPLSS